VLFRPDYFPQRHKRAPPRNSNEQRTRPWQAWILSSRQFPDDIQGNLLVANVIGFLGILQYLDCRQWIRVLWARKMTPFVQSDDPNFRPVDVKIGPDGAVYFSNGRTRLSVTCSTICATRAGIISTGGIYRVTCSEGPCLSRQNRRQSRFPNCSIFARARGSRPYRARTNGRRDSRRCSPRLMSGRENWIEGHQYEHNLMEALWIHQYHNGVDEALLKRMLRFT